MKKNELVTINGTTVEVSLDLYNHIIRNIRNGIENGEATIVSIESKAEVKTTKAKPKATLSKTTKTTKTTTKTTTKPKAKKSNDDFDYDSYKSIAQELGVYGKNGVWKCARPTVYKVMNKEMTIRQAKSEIAKVIKANGWDK